MEFLFSKTTTIILYKLSLQMCTVLISWYLMKYHWIETYLTCEKRNANIGTTLDNYQQLLLSLSSITKGGAHYSDLYTVYLIGKRILVK